MSTGMEPCVEGEKDCVPSTNAVMVARESWDTGTLHYICIGCKRILVEDRTKLVHEKDIDGEVTVEIGGRHGDGYSVREHTTKRDIRALIDFLEQFATPKGD